MRRTFPRSQRENTTIISFENILLLNNIMISTLYFARRQKARPARARAGPAVTHRLPLATTGTRR
jgi:hypothetical protein